MDSSVRFYNYLEARFERTLKDRRAEMASRIYKQFMTYKMKMLFNGGK
jgi:hypothetical protein